MPILGSPEWLDTAHLRRFQWTGIVADGKRCHTNKVPATPTSRSASRTSSTAPRMSSATSRTSGFGFSVTYYESNRPRQYYPDFIIAARDRDGREVMWLAETKGEIRPNTALKSEAARLWCEKMSGTKYGQWRYLFVQQRKLESALAAGVKSLAELAESLVVARPEPQLRLISLDDERVKREAFKTLLPLYSLKAAAGYFGRRRGRGARGLGRSGWPRQARRANVRCRAVGRSMEPPIHDGDYCVFRAKPTGTRQGKIVLAQYRGRPIRTPAGRSRSSATRPRRSLSRMARGATRGLPCHHSTLSLGRSLWKPRVETRSSWWQSLLLCLGGLTEPRFPNRAGLTGAGEHIGATVAGTGNTTRPGLSAHLIFTVLQRQG